MVLRVAGRYVVGPAAGCALAAVALTAWLIVLDGALEQRTGVERRVWPSVGFSGAPVLADFSPDVSLDFLDGDPNLPRRFFSVRWRGFWYVPEPVEIALYGAGDDRLDVWLDGALVIRRFPPADMHTEVQVLGLDAGVHELRVEYEQHGGVSSLYLAWARDVGGSAGSPEGRGPRRPRPIPPHRLFREWPAAEDIRLARRVERVERIVLAVWGIPAVFSVGFLVRRLRAVHARLGSLESGSPERRLWEKGWRIASMLTVAAIAVRAAWARLPGWNPESLWHDDLVYAAIVRADLWSMLTVPIHVAPGLFAIWRGFYELFPDPEWSLQILPFACAIAAIPVMFLVARRLTGDRGMGLLAAAVTALNPLLAHYSVFVHQFPFDFLVTALFLLTAVTLLERPARIDPRRFGGFAAAAGVAPLLSVTSVLVSFPVVHIAALASFRDRLRNRSRTVAMLVIAAAYDLAVLACWLLLRNRTNDAIRGGRFAHGFMPLDSLSEAWRFLTENGLRLLETSLASWEQTGIRYPVAVWMPDMVSWPVPFLLLGLVWLLARRRTRQSGLVAVGFYAAFLAASALGVYPLGTGRPDIFAFPVGILLFAAGVHLVTEPLPRKALHRAALASAAVGAALAQPLEVEYRESNAVRLAETLAANVRPQDGMILTWPAGFTAAFYGPWPSTVLPFDQAPNATQARLRREGTLHLPRAHDGSQERLVRQFLRGSRPRRIWFGASREPERWLPDVLETLEEHGYDVRSLVETTRGRLYLALRRNPS